MQKIRTLLIVLLTLPFLTFSQEHRVQDDEKMPENYRPDYRIDNMGYWRKMAAAGLVDVAPNVPPAPAIFKGSQINQRGIIRTDDSVDVPVTEENSTQSENSIFVNPDDIDNVLNSNNSTTNPVGTLYGANGLFSFNTGETWEGSIQGTGGTNSGDPAVTIGTNGYYYNGFINNGSGQSVARSMDQGQSWTSYLVKAKPSGFGSVLDKNHLWIDNSTDSPYEGHLYSGWTSFGGANDDEIEICRSTDDAETWSAAINVSSGVNAGSHCQGVNIHTGPNGEVYVVFAIYDGGGNENALGLAKSYDGGASYEPATRIITGIMGIRSGGTSKNMRVNSFPSMAVDISNGPDRGNLYVVWANKGVPGINTGDDIDAYMIRSSDEGETWSDPVRVNQDAIGEGKEHYFPWITCDPETGTLAVIWYDDRDVSAPTMAEAWCGVSYDAGETWDDFRVSDVSFTPAPIPGLAGSYFGDYLGITSKGGVVYPCWTDNRTGVAMTYVSPFETIAEPYPATEPSPSNGSGGIYPFTSYNWKDSRSRSTHFKIYIGTDNPPSNIVNGEFVNDTTYYLNENLNFEEQYFWRIVSYNDYGSAESSTWSFTTGSPPDEDFETGNFNNQDWYFEGDIDWIIDNTVARNGTFSARSGPIDHDQQTSLLIELDIFSSIFQLPITFWKKVSSQEEYDKLEFYIDDELKAEWSGEDDWTLESFLVTGGLHTFEWRYTKNGAGSIGNDAGWIDYIIFPPLNILAANAGPDATICENDIYQPDGEAYKYTAIEWTTSGDGNFDDPLILNPVYTPGNNDIASGSVILTLSASDDTDDVSDDMELTLQHEAFVEMPEEAEVCIPDDYQITDIIADNFLSLDWSSSGDGTFDDPALLEPIYTPGNEDVNNGMATLTLVATGYYPCGNFETSMILYVNDIPSQPGAPSGLEEVCQNGDDTEYSIEEVPEAKEYIWNVMPEGAGTITGNTITAIVDWNEEFDGMAEISVIASNDCGESDFSLPYEVNVLPLPEKAAMPSGDDYVCVNYVDFTDYETVGAENAAYYEWFISPSDAGTVSGTGTTGTVVWNDQYVGMANLSVKGINDCGDGLLSDEFEIETDICTGINEPGTEIQFAVYPNPNEGVFKIEMKAETKSEINIRVMNSINEIVFERNNIRMDGSRSIDINLSGQADGVYFLYLETSNSVSVEKIIIQ